MLQTSFSLGELFALSRADPTDSQLDYGFLMCLLRFHTAWTQSGRSRQAVTAKSGHQGWLESGPKDYALSPIIAGQTVTTILPIC